MLMLLLWQSRHMQSGKAPGTLRLHLVQTGRLTVCGVKVQLDILDPRGGANRKILTILARRFCQSMANRWRKCTKQDRKHCDPGSQPMRKEMAIVHVDILNVMRQNSIK